MAERRLHLVCNAHIDPTWLWEWQEGAAEACSTFRTAADLCEEFEDFVFCHNESILYKWVEEYEPALFERIRRLVREGKWHVMGGWYLQPDCNMPSGESFVRQSLVGRRYFAEKFGAVPTTAINFDPFGHSRGLVQILAKSGYDSYLFCRPAQADCPLESDSFIWVGYDGSEVLAHRSSEFYPSHMGKARAKVEDWLRSHPAETPLIVLWGVGDHGGGPTMRDLRDLEALRRETRDVKIVHSTPEAYFRDLLKSGRQLPRHAKDLNPWAVGCYTSQIRIKQKHRLLENELYSLEKMASAAWALGLMPYPKPQIDEALCDLLFSEFHDILPGSSAQPNEENSLRVLDHGLEIASRLKTRAFFALAAGQPKAKQGEITVLVYNHHPFPVRTLLEAEFQLPDQNWTDSFTNVTVHRAGKTIPAQVEKEEGNVNLDWRKRVVFQAELKPSRINRFDCRLRMIPRRPAPGTGVDKNSITIKTGDLEVVVNRNTGLIDRYRVAGKDYLGPDAFLPIVIRDNEDSWGMTTRSFRKIAGRFRLMSPRAAARFAGVRAATLEPVRVIEDGPVRSVVEALFAYRGSSICQRYKLPKVGAEIEVETRVHWNEKDRMLKLAIPLRGDRLRYIGQVAYGRDQLPANGDEAVAQKWVAVVDKRRRRAVTVINDGTYGSDFSKNDLRLTLLRSPAYAGHPIGDRPIVPQDRYTPRIDQGVRVFRFWLQGGAADESLRFIDREALAKNEKPFVLSCSPSGAGDRPKPFITLSDDVVLVTAVKRAEEGDDIIVRLFEPTGEKRRTTLALPFISLSKTVTLRPFEIKTLRVNLKERTFVETDLMEKPL